MAGIDDLLAEAAALVARNDAVRGDFHAVRADFLSRASHTQASVFAAACVERAAATLFWIVARDGRQDELDLYTRALEQLWRADNPSAAADAVTSRQIEHTKELTVGDEALGGAAYGYSAAVAMHAALRYGETGDVADVKGCSQTLENQASTLDRRNPAGALAEELNQQRMDIAALLANSAVAPSTVSAMRDRARSAARARWELVRSRYPD